MDRIRQVLKEKVPVAPEVQPTQEIVEPEVAQPQVEFRDISDPAEIKVPTMWQGVGLEQAIYEAHNAGDLALKEFDKAPVTTTNGFTCVCGLIFMHQEPFDEHRAFAHPEASHETEIARLNVERYNSSERWRRFH